MILMNKKMKINIKTFLLTTFLNLILITSAPAEPLTRDYPTKDGFTVKMSENWKPIPKNVLDAYTIALEKFAPNMQKQVYDYGYQLASNENWLVYPYILIQIKNTGKVPQRELRNLKKLQHQIELSASNASEALGKVISVLNSGDMIYDETNHIVFSIFTMDVEKAGKVKGLISVILTNQGSINLYGYALESEFDKYSAFYMDVAKNIQVNETLRYTAGLNIPWGYILIGIIVVGVVFFLRRKRKADNISSFR